MATFDVRSSPVIVVVCPLSPLTFAALGPGPAYRIKHLHLVRQYGVGGPPRRLRHYNFILSSCWRLLAARECL